MTDNVQFNFPAISVVIPMYNVEKYIGECLNSLLVQTFKNFEVIVVDDCSTDKSCVIVESYAEKFGGRLKLFHTNKNSGSGTEPRNFGLAYSRGEYLYFMDNDDAITPTALQVLYTHAKNFDADVVHCEKFYIVPQDIWNNAVARKQLKPYNYLTGYKPLIKKPLVWQDNFEERIKFFCQKKLIWNFWVQLVRRDFLIANTIKMVGIVADDLIFTICEICSAPKYIVVPDVIYFYRQIKDSLIHKKVSVNEQLARYTKMLKDGVRYLDNFWRQRNFFAQRTDLKYMLLNLFVQDMLKYLPEIYSKIPVHALDESVRKEFSDGDNLALNSFIFSLMNIQRLQLITAQRRIAELETALKSKS